jgi:ubiquinone/menaquinone biosynthesis C-methylase UbiE
MSTHSDRVVRQFTDRAEAYLNSQVHATGNDLSFLAERAKQLNARNVLDVGSGAGHASFAVAPYSGRVTALDPSFEMLRVLEKGARDRSIGNIETKEGRADRIPFENGSFDLVVSRFSGHHWRDPEASMKEIRRVAVPGGAVLIVDSSAPEDPLRDTWLQTIELLRDRTHVRSYRISEWTAMAGKAGLSLRSFEVRKLRLLSTPWLERAGTPPECADAIFRLFDEAPDEVRNYLAIGGEYDFTIDVALLEAISVGDHPVL